MKIMMSFEDIRVIVDDEQEQNDHLITLLNSNIIYLENTKSSRLKI